MIRIVTEPTDVDKGLIADALAHCDLTLPDVLGKIESGFYVALRASESIVTLHQTEDSLHVAQYSGTRKDFPEVWPALKTIAGELGKEYITTRGRKGLSRLLKPWGFEQHGLEMRYTL